MRGHTAREVRNVAGGETPGTKLPRDRMVFLCDYYIGPGRIGAFRLLAELKIKLRLFVSESSVQEIDFLLKSKKFRI